MKLELKHLAPYMPYGLKYVKYSDNNSPIRHDIMQGVSTNGIYACGDITPLSFKNCKPILRPLSDLTKVEEEYSAFIEFFGNESDIDYLCEFKGNIYSSSLSYSCVTFLIRNHYDIFNLIEKGLAIDINTLED